MNMMVTSTSGNSQENLNYQKVLLNETATSSVYTTAATTDTQQQNSLNIQPLQHTTTLDNPNERSTSHYLNPNILLMSPGVERGAHHQTSFLLSPVAGSDVNQACMMGIFNKILHTTIFSM